MPDNLPPTQGTVRPSVRPGSSTAPVSTGTAARTTYIMVNGAPKVVDKERHDKVSKFMYALNHGDKSARAHFAGLVNAANTPSAFMFHWKGFIQEKPLKQEDQWLNVALNNPAQAEEIRLLMHAYGAGNADNNGLRTALTSKNIVSSSKPNSTFTSPDLPQGGFAGARSSSPGVFPMSDPASPRPGR